MEEDIIPGKEYLMDFSINQFGSLTTQNGQKLTFKDFDKDGNGEITKNEYEEVLKEVKLDSVDFASVDADDSKTISQEEFKALEQKIQMQDSVNEQLKKVAADVKLSKYAAEIMTELKSLMEEFIASYKGDISAMAEQFKSVLEEKVAQITQAKQSDVPDEIKDRVLDDILSEFSPEFAKKADVLLSKEADRFIKSYTGSNLEVDLKTHLLNYLNQSDAANMGDAAAKFNHLLDSLGFHLSDSDKIQIKEAVTELLQTAVALGIILKVGKTNITGEASIKSLIASYTDINTLVQDIKNALDGLSKESKRYTLMLEVQNDFYKDYYASEESALKSIKGSDLQVVADTTQIEGYFSNKKVKIKGQSKDGAIDDACKFLESSLKEQLSAKIYNILADKGVPFYHVEDILENVFNKAALDAANECVSGKHGTWFRKSSSEFHIKDLVDCFMTKFNAGISEAIDAKNASSKDFDIVDMDISRLGKDDSGNDIAENGEDFTEAYKTGTVITTKKKGSEYYVGIAAKLLEGLKWQLTQKARAMCAANGVEFSQTKFDAAFDSAKTTAIAASVEGSGATDGSLKRAGIIAGGVTAGAGLPLGILAGGISLLFGHHSKSSLDVRTLVDTFLQTFKEEYTNRYKN